MGLISQVVMAMSLRVMCVMLIRLSKSGIEDPPVSCIALHTTLIPQPSGINPASTTLSLAT